MLKIVGLVLALLGIIFVLQNRDVGGWIAGARIPADAARRLGAAAPTSRRDLACAGDRLHRRLYLAYSLHIEGGFVYVLRATALSLSPWSARRCWCG